MYKIEFRDLKFSEDRKEYSFGDYLFKQNDDHIVLECPEESTSFIRNAMQLALAKNVVFGICDNEIQSMYWEKRKVLFVYYSPGETRRVKVTNIIDEESLLKVESWYNYLKYDKKREIVNSWNFALQEYYSACNVDTIEQGILSLITALEALFSPGSSELVYRVSLNTAMYLGDSPEKRKKLFDMVKNMYDLRSKMVHGDVSALSKKLKSSENDYLFFELKYIVSTALFKTKDISKDDLIKLVENKIFS